MWSGFAPCPCRPFCSKPQVPNTCTCLASRNARGDLQGSQPPGYALPSHGKTPPGCCPSPIPGACPSCGGTGDAALPCPAASPGAAAGTARGVCCRWIAQLWGSGKQLLPHICQQGELSKDLLCSKGPGAAACPSTVPGPPWGCSLCSIKGCRAVRICPNFCAGSATQGCHHHSVGRRGDEHGHLGFGEIPAGCLLRRLSLFNILDDPMCWQP